MDRRRLQRTDLPVCCEWLCDILWIMDMMGTRHNILHNWPSLFRICIVPILQGRVIILCPWRYIIIFCFRRMHAVEVSGPNENDTATTTIFCHRRSTPAAYTCVCGPVDVLCSLYLYLFTEREPRPWFSSPTLTSSKFLLYV